MGFAFNSLPFNTLVGADRATFNRITRRANIENRERYLTTKLCERLLAPLYNINNQKFKSIRPPKIVSPIFIIGHWRSGTTFVHNLLSRDPQFGYCTTYQTVFPHLMLCGESIFKRIAGWCMPDSRPTDHLRLSVEQPQEEEFAIANMTYAAFYHFWIFPQNMEYYLNRYLLFESCTYSEKYDFCQATEKMMQTALYCQHKPRFLSKNPPHTARIALLLKMFPDAKFIYIVRNPYAVISSTRRFFSSTISALSLQSIPPCELELQILNCYRAMIERYESDRHLIPPQNLYEMRFEEFSANPVEGVEAIYERLKLGDFNTIADAVTEYAATQADFCQSHYKNSESSAKLIEKYCSATFKRWNY